jgi:hypothetical protein
MKYKSCLLPLFIFLASAPCYADLVGTFDGLDNLIDRSDAVVVVRVERHIDTSSSPTLTTTHLCYVLKSFKGDAPAGRRLPLRLRDTTNSFREKFRLSSVHVVFLIKQPRERGGIAHRSLPYEGANIEVSPLFNEGMLKGNSIKENIKQLIRDYVEYRVKEMRREDELFDRILKS